MGRCYEFGVVIREGCDHAMVVPAEGGRCECPTCGAVCPGRFSGCTTITSRPGYVPVLAPAWATQPGARPPELGAPSAPTLAPVEVVGESVDPPDGALRPLEAILEEAFRAPSDALQRLEELAAHIDKRDEELADAFERLERAHADLVAQLNGLAEGQRYLSEALAAVEARLIAFAEDGDRSTLASIRGLLRRT